MNKRLLTLACLLVLTACKSTSTSYLITIDPSQIDKEDSLSVAALRVVERRLSSMGEEPIDLNIERMGGDSRIFVELADKTILDILTEQLVNPFKIRVMEEAEPGEEGAIAVEGHGSFKQTGLENEHFVWLAAEADVTPGKGRVIISFGDEGREIMATVFDKNVGKFIGIFVRDQLVSKLQVETDKVLDDIVITDIPSLDLAKIFADDVNVGLYVTFTPVE